MIVIKRILKQVLPAPIKRWIKRIVVKAVGHDSQIQDVIERTDSLFQIFEQQLQQLASDIATQRSTAQQMRTELIDRSDSLFEIMEQNISRTRVELNDAVAELQTIVTGVPKGEKLSSADYLGGLIKPDEYKGFQAIFRGGDDLITQRLEPHIRAMHGRKRVLDIGCGDGLFLELLREAGIDAVGVDSNKAMVDAARQRGVRVLEQSVQTAVERLSSGEYDAITALHIIEHMLPAQLRQFLERCYELLPEGGLLLMEMPNICNLTTLTRSYFADPTHLMPRDPRLIAFILESIGFRDVLITEINDFPNEGQLVRDLTGSTRNSDLEIAGPLKHILEIYEANFSRLNALFYVGMDVVITATKTGAGES